jgi:hypothetical protein
MKNINNILQYIAFTVAAISSLLTLLNMLLVKIEQNKKLKKLKSKNFELVLQSSDIKKLGNYLDNEIGQLTISNYVENENINKEINELINKLMSFVGTNEQIIKESKREAENTNEIFNEYNVKFEGKFKDEFNKIYNELNHGESWNALAQLRRFIEISLKKFAKKNNISTDKIHSIIQLIETLKRNELIDNYSYINLKNIIYICNKAIHGEDIDINKVTKEIENGMITLYKIIENK